MPGRCRARRASSLRTYISPAVSVDIIHQKFETRSQVHLSFHPRLAEEPFVYDSIVTHLVDLHNLEESGREVRVRSGEERRDARIRGRTTIDS